MADQPNILLLFTDQHRLSACGAYGSTPCRTPTLDRLASEGVRFENAYTVCPACSPARGTVMTGVYPHSHGICSNVHNLGCSVHELRDRPGLLSRRLEQAGYNLGYTGKWHLGTSATEDYFIENTPSLPKDVGFEGQNFPGHGGGGFMYPEYQEYLRENGYEHRLIPDANGETHFAWGTLAGPLESTVPYFLASNTISMMERFRTRNSPFFIWHNNWGPHGPYYATREYVDMYRDVDIPEWPNFRWESRNIPGAHWNKLHPRNQEMTWDEWALLVRYYYAFTSMVDGQFARILHHLESSGLDRNTIIVFAADHGETCGSHGGLTDKGYHHFEETHRIPLIIRMPDRSYRGTTIDAFASLADLYPTILSMAGAEYDADALHGHSLLPLIENPAVEWRDQVVTEFSGVNNVPMTQRTLRWRHFKYGFNCSGEDELYDLQDDPWEMQNRINHPEYRETGRELRRRMLEWMAETDDPTRGIFELSKVQYYDG